MNIRRKPRFEDELDRIRVELYEETKDLTSEECTRRSNELGEKLAKQYGFKIAKPGDRSAYQDEA